MTDDQLLAIVTDLANWEEPDGGGYCHICEHHLRPPSWAPDDKTYDHAPDCLIRRAREWVDARQVGG